MKVVFILLNIFVILFAEESLDVNAYIAFDSEYFNNKTNYKQNKSITTIQRLEIKSKKNNITKYLSCSAQVDYYDLKESTQHTHRTFFRLDELYIEFLYDKYKLFLGKNKRFWGSLELNNIVDTFNLRELRNNVFDNEKQGAWNTSISYYTQTGELSLIVKLYEEDQKMATNQYIFNLLPYGAIYNDNLVTEKTQTYPTVYIKYSDSVDGEYPLDWSIIFQHGYDSQRYFTSESNVYLQNAYLVNKVLMYGTWLLNSNIFKFEVIYADVISDLQVSDYIHVGIGYEYDMENIFDLNNNFKIFSEYYGLYFLEDKPYSDLELLSIYQNDFFIGLKYGFNDMGDSSILIGSTIDLDYNEKSFTTKYETRISKNLKLNIDYTYVLPSKNYNTAYKQLGKTQILNINMKYYF